jgi:putative ABC transport system ATP-binding protein
VPDGQPVSAPLFAVNSVSLVSSGSPLLDRIDCWIPRGAVTALLGPSGAGKTLLLRLLNRFEEPDQGQILLDGVPLPEFDVLALRRRVGLVGQRPVALTATVADEVRVGRSDLDQSELMELLRVVRLTDLDLQRSTAGLSGGELQRLSLARALAVEPEVLLLDEPTSALDAEAAAAVDEIIGSLVDRGCAVVVVSHDLNRVRRLADHAVVLRAGRVVQQGSPESLAYLAEDLGGT